MDKPYIGHSAEHDILSTTVETRVPAFDKPGSSRLVLRTNVTDGAPGTTVIIDPDASRVVLDVTMLESFSLHVMGHLDMIQSAVVRHQAALTGLGESWVNDTSPTIQQSDQEASR